MERDGGYLVKGESSWVFTLLLLMVHSWIVLMGDTLVVEGSMGGGSVVVLVVILWGPLLGKRAERWMGSMVAVLVVVHHAGRSHGGTSLNGGVSSSLCPHIGGHPLHFFFDSCRWWPWWWIWVS